MSFKLLVDQSATEDQFEYIKEETNNKSRPSYYVTGPYMMCEEVNKNKRIYDREEMHREAKRYKSEMIDTKRAMGELNHPSCITKSASILCEDGWKNVTEVSDTEKVYTLNPETKEIELHQITRKIDQAYEGKMFKIKGRNIDTLVTPTHKFLVMHRYNKYSYVTIEEIFNNRTKYNHSYIPKRGIWNADTPEFFTLKGIPNVSKKGNYNIDPETDSKINYETFVQFLGIWLAEGWTSSDKDTIVAISQKKEDVKEKIRNLLSKFPEEMKWKEFNVENGSTTFMLYDLRLATFLKENFGTNCYNKKIAKEFKNLSAPLLEEMIYWFNLGDGRFNAVIQECGEYEIRNIFSTSKQLILDFNEILLKSGASGNITTIITEADYTFADRIIKSENKVPLYLLNIGKTNGIHLDERFLKIEEVEDFDDRVYCVTVQNENFYCMDNGKVFWTGNSPDVSLERACHLVTELRNEGNVYIGKSKLLSTPSGLIVQALIDDGVKIGMSTRALGKLNEQYNGTSRVSDFRLVAVDCVADPSCPKAFVNGILESKEYVLAEDGSFEESYDRFQERISQLPRKNVEDYLKEQIIDFFGKISKVM